MRLLLGRNSLEALVGVVDEVGYAEFSSDCPLLLLVDAEPDVALRNAQQRREADYLVLWAGFVDAADDEEVVRAESRNKGKQEFA